MANWLGFTHTPLKADPYVAQADKSELSAKFQQLADAISASEAPQGSYPDLVARIKAIEAAMGQTGYRNLRIVTNATTPAAKLDISWDAMGIGGYQVGALSGQTIDVSVVGLNGRDFTTLATGMLYVWALYNPTTKTVGFTFSQSATAPTLTDSTFSGYIASRCISDVKQTGSSASLRGYSQQDFRITLDTAAAVAGALSASGSPPGWVAQSLASFVGARCHAAHVQLVQNLNNTGGSPTFMEVRRKGVASAETGVGVFERPNNGGDVRGITAVGLGATQEVEWRASVAVTASGGQGIFIKLPGYEVSV